MECDYVCLCMLRYAAPLPGVVFLCTLHNVNQTLICPMQTMVADLCRVFDPSHTGLSPQALTTYFEAKNRYWHLADREGSSNITVEEWKSQYTARMEQLGLTHHRETAEDLIGAMLGRECDCTSEAEAVFWLEETRTRHGCVHGSGCTL